MCIFWCIEFLIDYQDLSHIFVQCRLAAKHVYDNNILCLSIDLFVIFLKNVHSDSLP